MPGPCGCGDAPGFLLDLPPVAAVLSVEALVGGAYVPVATWRSLSPNRRGSLALLRSPGTRWPTTDPDPAAWRIRFRAGYATPAEVPPPIQAAILLIAADLFDNRGGKQLATLTDNPTIARLLARYQPSEARGWIRASSTGASPSGAAPSSPAAAARCRATMPTCSGPGVPGAR